MSAKIRHSAAKLGHRQAELARGRYTFRLTPDTTKIELIDSNTREIIAKIYAGAQSARSITILSRYLDYATETVTLEMIPKVGKPLVRVHETQLERKAS